MQALINNIAATFIAGMILLMVLFLQFRSQATTIEAAQYSMAKTDQFQAVEILEMELRNAGAGIRHPVMTFTGGTIDTTSCFTSPSATCSFTFWTRLDSTLVDTMLVRYDWTQTGTIRLTGHNPGSTPIPQPVYSVTRFVNGTAWGHLLDRATDFRIRMFDRLGNPINGNPQDTRRLQVRFEVPTRNTMKPTGIETVEWESVFWPVNLTRE